MVYVLVSPTFKVSGIALASDNSAAVGVIVNGLDLRKLSPI